jgi:hypothetical protein
MQEVARIGGKVILVDPTGEFHTYDDGVEHIFLGGEKRSAEDTQTVSFPYWNLTELDLFARFSARVVRRKLQSSEKRSKSLKCPMFRMGREIR